MPELRKDPVTGRWVIISTDRQKRPNDFRVERSAAVGREYCPFCPGHEEMTPPEVLSYRQNGGAPNAPGWDVRVVPNKFPALQVEGSLDREGEGLFDRMNGIGAHEVIIETPDHDRSMALMSEPELERVLWAFRERMLDLKQDHRLRYILVFKNQGAAAGATLEHPHSQLIALPIVPDFVREEIDGARRHYAIKERCVFCDIVHQELREGRRVIQENADIIALAPYAPRFAFETWLLPKRHGARYEQAARHEYESLARLLKSVLQRLDRALETPPFNLIVHTSPFSEEVADLYHWHIEIIPKLTRVAGFEWGTGFYINPTSPEEAAKVLRAVRL
ncbi:MAG TPA: galactose-1-phosphate uridylyltransferase [Vicinamibacterales bacterium]|nr:galactose-1-phosphate uridylyltransferase [Vicinamibacterales bacterium]